MATSVKDGGSKDTVGNRDARLDALYERLSANDLAPYWAVDSDADHDEDGQVLKGAKALPFIWRYADIKPILYEAAELITMEDSERRSVVLLNPGLDPVRAAVSSLYIAYRLNDPREIMPPHAHSINAVRIGLTGEQSFTGVVIGAELQYLSGPDLQLVVKVTIVALLRNDEVSKTICGFEVAVAFVELIELDERENSEPRAAKLGGLAARNTKTSRHGSQTVFHNHAHGAFCGFDFPHHVSTRGGHVGHGPNRAAVPQEVVFRKLEILDGLVDETAVGLHEPRRATRAFIGDLHGLILADRVVDRHRLALIGFRPPGGLNVHIPISLKEQSQQMIKGL